MQPDRLLRWPLVFGSNIAQFPKNSPKLREMKKMKER
jgi:hypothetical protein